MKAFVVLLCFALFAVALAVKVEDNTKETPEENEVEGDGEKNPGDQEKFFIKPLLNLLSGKPLLGGGFGGIGGLGGLGGLGGGHGGFGGYYPPPYGYPPYGGYGGYRPPFY